ncbi:unnamed protein product [Amoebophrya sp. A120]|nr:unnamed protein product [Amoebophrya sp. A120]|eukprot:GSA120T00020689001.1
MRDNDHKRRQRQRRAAEKQSRIQKILDQALSGLPRLAEISINLDNYPGRTGATTGTSSDDLLESAGKNNDFICPPCPPESGLSDRAQRGIPVATVGGRDRRIFPRQGDEDALETRNDPARSNSPSPSSARSFSTDIEDLDVLDGESITSEETKEEPYSTFNTAKLDLFLEFPEIELSSEFAIPWDTIPSCLTGSGSLEQIWAVSGEGGGGGSGGHGATIAQKILTGQASKDEQSANYTKNGQREGKHEIPPSSSHLLKAEAKRLEKFLKKLKKQVADGDITEEQMAERLQKHGKQQGLRSDSSGTPEVVEQVAGDKSCSNNNSGGDRSAVSIIPAGRAASTSIATSTRTSSARLTTPVMTAARDFRKKQQIQNIYQMIREMRIEEKTTTEVETDGDHENSAMHSSNTNDTKITHYDIVDFGCGSGNLTLPLAFLLPNTTFLLLDKNKESVDLAKKRAELAGLKNVKAVVSDLAFTVTNDDSHILGRNASFSLGLGLHCCGNFSDLVLEICLLKNADCVLVPCCHGKILQLDCFKPVEIINRRFDHYRTANQFEDFQFPRSKTLRHRLAMFRRQMNKQKTTTSTTNLVDYFELLTKSADNLECEEAKMLLEYDRALYVMERNFLVRQQPVIGAIEEEGGAGRGSEDALNDVDHRIRSSRNTKKTYEIALKRLSPPTCTAKNLVLQVIGKAA